MSDEERDDFPNLIYLCTRHHRAVDAKASAEKYPTWLLKEWKKDAESGVESLTSSQPVTADQLEAFIAKAMTERNQILIETVERLRTSDTEAYWLMQQLLSELKDARRLGSVIDPDAVSLLFSAAKMLNGLEDNAQVLSTAATTYLKAIEMRGRLE